MPDMREAVTEAQLSTEDDPPELSERVSRAIASLIKRFPDFSMVKNYHGEAVLEKRDGDRFESYRVFPDGRVKHCVFEDCKIVQDQFLCF